MNISTNFKQTIAATFYDKELIKYSSDTTTESDGWTRKGTLVEVDRFMGNVNFSNLKQVQEDHGIVDQIDMTVTTSAEIERDTIIGYSDRLYKVIEAKVFDSHYLLIAQKWSSRLQT